MSGPEVEPPCADHQPRQHRDGKPPWCDNCGRPAAPSNELATLRARIAAALEIHSPYGPPEGHTWVGTKARDLRCDECGGGDPFNMPPWPCRTARALGVEAVPE